MPKLFDSIQIRKPRLNKFDLSHERKMSLQMGKLVPLLVTDVVPGDKFQVSTEIMMRMAPMLAPIMHRVDVYTHYFFVPNRLVWSEWEDFITGGRLGTAAPVAPYLRTDDFHNLGINGVGTLYDYMGLPITAAAAENVRFSAFPFRAYQTIYNEYYRDQNLTAEINFSLSSGAQDATQAALLAVLRDRAWEKDYFTSALPFAQRGASIEIPLSDDPTVQTKAYRTSTGLPYSQAGDMTIGNTGNVLMTGSASEDGGVHIGPEGHGVNVNDLRRSIRLQEWLEKNARGGARYIEQILSHFGIRSSDARLQRPEYLGGGKQNVQISEVLSTIADTPSPLGDMAGHGMAIGRSNRFRRTFEEHGYIIGIMSVLPRTAYQQGVPRHFTRHDKFDYFWPELANIGEQEVLNKELYFTGNLIDLPESTFGYQSRYAEYKYGCSSVHGDFKDNLDFWHMGRIFTALPTLNEDFIESDPTQRIFADTTAANHKIWCHLYNKIDALRPMPYFGTPTL